LQAKTFNQAGIMNRQGRFDGIDFWRGCVLCMIFVDHMPGNIFENVTPRNYGFSDAAEAFVFLSGVSIALAYGGHFSIGERLRTFRGLVRRALKLYGVHIGLSLIAMAIFFAGAAWARRPELLEVHGRALFVDNPGLATLGLVSLGHQLGYFNILPLYMVLILCVPALLWLAQIDRRLMLGCSALVYGLVRFYGWNLPSWPAPGVWFFDPFAWQFLFAIGIAIGLSLRDGFPPLSRSLLAFAALIVAASALVVIHGFGGARDAWQPLRNALDLDKAQLGAGRLVHFLALAYLLYGLRLTERLRSLPVYRPLALLGRHSLWVFASVSLFSAVWQVVIEVAPRAPWFDILFAGGALIVIYLVMRMIDAPSGGRGSADPSDRLLAAPAKMEPLFGVTLRELRHYALWK
jgi:hypothetical protein